MASNFFLKYLNIIEKDNLKPHVSSEFILAKDWNTTLEDEAWKYL